MKFYRVTFCTKHGRKQFKTHYFCDIEADNIAVAKKRVAEIWEETHTQHPFHVAGKRLMTNVICEYPACVDDYPEVQKTLVLW